MSGVFASGRARVIIPPIITPTDNGPVRNSAHLSPTLALPQSVRRSSLVVIGCAHL